MFNYDVPIKHKQMKLVSNGGKFKLYTVRNGLLFSMPTQPGFSFERMILTRLRHLLRFISIGYVINIIKL